MIRSRSAWYPSQAASSEYYAVCTECMRVQSRAVLTVKVGVVDARSVWVCAGPPLVDPTRTVSGNVRCEEFTPPEAQVFR